MGESRSRRRIYDGFVYLYAADTSQGWAVHRMITTEQGLGLVERGNADVYEDEYGIYFQMRANFKLDEDMPEGEISKTYIHASESKMNAGLSGESRTIRLNEAMRMSQPLRPGGHRPPPEDDIEKAIEKVKQWPEPASRIDDGTNAAPLFGDRAPRVYPRIAPPLISRVPIHGNQKAVRPAGLFRARTPRIL
jgi:hypothetical protein